MAKSQNAKKTSIYRTFGKIIFFSKFGDFNGLEASSKFVPKLINDVSFGTGFLHKVEGT